MKIPINIEAKNYCFQCISPPSMFKLIQCFNMTRSLYEGDLLNCASVYCLIVSHYLQLFFIDFSLIEMHTHWQLTPGLPGTSITWPGQQLQTASSSSPWLMDPVQWMPVFAGLVQAVRRILGGAGDSAVARCHYHYQAPRQSVCSGDHCNI